MKREWAELQLQFIKTKTKTRPVRRVVAWSFGPQENQSVSGTLVLLCSRSEEPVSANPKLMLHIMYLAAQIQC